MCFQVFRLSLYSILFLILFQCSDPVSSKKNKYDLPKEFPLKVGTAWIYEDHYFESGKEIIDRDTLYIFGKKDDYFLYSWSPEYYYDLVKNHDNKLLLYGGVEVDDDEITEWTMDKPEIWAYFSEDTGYVDLRKLDDKYSIWYDAVHISILPDMPCLNGKFDTYFQEEFAEDWLTDTFINKIGFAMFSDYNPESGELNFESKMIRKLDNFYPPDSILKKSISNRSKIMKKSKEKSHPFVKF